MVDNPLAPTPQSQDAPQPLQPAVPAPANMTNAGVQPSNPDWQQGDPGYWNNPGLRTPPIRWGNTPPPSLRGHVQTPPTAPEYLQSVLGTIHSALANPASHSPREATLAQANAVPTDNAKAGLAALFGIGPAHAAAGQAMLMKPQAIGDQAAAPAPAAPTQLPNDPIADPQAVLNQKYVNLGANYANQYGYGTPAMYDDHTHAVAALHGVSPGTAHAAMYPGKYTDEDFLNEMEHASPKMLDSMWAMRLQPQEVAQHRLVEIANARYAAAKTPEDQATAAAGLEQLLRSIGLPSAYAPFNQGMGMGMGR